ncbi:MAG: hypothetical protein M3N23_00490, partial [Pseudomonadota bacterium]|nr:hypothetical protein [Pseudomonadota bacterium]
MPSATAPTVRANFIARWLWPLRFVLILLIPLSLFDALRFGRMSGLPNLFAFWPVMVNFVILSAIDYAVGRDRSQPAAQVREIALYKWIALAALP